MYATNHAKRQRAVPVVGIVLSDGRVVTTPLRRDGVLGEILGKRRAPRRGRFAVLGRRG